MRLLPTLSTTEISRLGRGVFGKIVLVALIAVPSIYGGLLTWSNLDAPNRLDAVPAAVVNNDEPVTVKDANGKNQIVPLGRAVTGKLVGSDATNNLSWRLTDSSDASEGLADGRYYAVLTIPKGFSKAATSTADASTARQAQLDLRTNDATSYLAGNIASAIGARLSQSTGDQLTQTYLDRIYIGFNSIQEQMAKAADGASKLADGTGQLTTGLTSAKQGSGSLASGLGQLKGGTAQLSSGVGQLEGGANSLASGAGRLAAGNAQLAQGLGQARDQTAQLPAQTKALADGGRRLSGGAAQLASGTAQLSAELDKASAATSGLPGQVTELAAGVRAFSTGVRAFADGATRLGAGAREVADGGAALADGATRLADGADRLAPGVTEYTRGVDALAEQCRASGADAAYCAQLAALARQSPALRSGATELAGGGAPLRRGAARLEKGADALGSGAAQLSSRTGEITGGATKLADGLDAFAASAPQLGNGIRQAATAVDRLDSGAQQLSGGLARLTTGLDALAAGTPQLTAGIAQAAGAATQLSTGATALQQGATKLATGASSAADGARKLDAAAGQAADGATKLDSGLGRLTDGAAKADDGANTLADGLKKGAASVPTYDAADRRRLATVVAEPVGDDAVRLHQVATYGAGLAPYFVALGLWVGGMGLFFMFRPVPRRAIASTAASWRIALAGFLPTALLGVLQALVLFFVLQVLLDIQIASPWLFIGFALLASMTFIAINQALVAALGPAGRFLGLILIVLQLSAAGATYPIETAPAFFQAIHSFLPLTYAVRAFRSLIAGGTLHLAPAAVVLAVWFVAALVVTTLTARRDRTWSIARLRPQRVAA